MANRGEYELDRRLENVLRFLEGGELPESVGIYNLPTFAQMMTGGEGRAARKKVRASLRRLGVKLEV